MATSVCLTLQDDPEQYREESDHRRDHNPDASPSVQPNPKPSISKGSQLSGLRRSSLSGKWRPLSQHEFSQKRAHQKALLPAVKLLTIALQPRQQGQSQQEASHDSLPVASGASRGSAQENSNQQEAKSVMEDNVTDAQSHAGVAGAGKDVANAAAQDSSAGFSRLASMLEGLCTPQELKAHVMTACQVVDPGMGYAGVTSAIAGRLCVALPHVYLSVYLSLSYFAVEHADY